MVLCIYYTFDLTVNIEAIIIRSKYYIIIIIANGKSWNIILDKLLQIKLKKIKTKINRGREFKFKGFKK